ncbi:T9SS type A sorting domain-containing protein [Labilibacter sediminis]|nr:T9SS type A sorting domain-containing protein [Labilibacter sediminis]
MKYSFILLLLCAFSYSSAQLSITSFNTTYNITFDQSFTGINNGSFNGSGFSSIPSDGQINSNGIVVTGLSDGDMTFGDNSASGDFSRGASDGQVGTGGIYSFETKTGDFSLGIQPTSSDFNPGDIILKIQNNIGQQIKELNLNYDLLFYNNEGRSTTISLSYSLDNNSYTNIPNTNIITPTSASDEPVWVSNPLTAFITENIENSGLLYLKWTFDDTSGSGEGSGSRDEIALDNIAISAKSTPGTPTAISKTMQSKVKSYPNPFNDYIQIESSTQIQQIELINSVGQSILQSNYVNSNKATINTESLDRGVYILRVTDFDHHITSQKLMK